MPTDKKNDDNTTLDLSGAKDPNYLQLPIVLAVLLSIGFAMAYGLFKLDSKNADVYEAKFETIRSMDLQYVFLAFVVLGRTISMLNFVPTGYKNGLKGNIRSNPFFYQTTDGTLVTYKDDGVLGKYNRSNRSVQHMVENAGGFFASVAAIGWVFPKQVLGITMMFSLGRIIHQKGYSSGYGSHALGFVAFLLSVLSLEGLALLAFFKGQGIL